MNVTVPTGWKRTPLIVLALVAVVAVAWFLHKSGGRRGLAQTKAELRAKGEKLTYAELTGGRFETNGTARSETIFGLVSRLPHGGDFPMGLVNDTMHLEASGRARVVWRRTEPPGLTPRGSDTAAPSWNDYAQEVSEAGGTLRQLRAELVSPPLDMGWDYDRDPLGAPRINFVAMRNGAQWLAGATLVALHGGDTTNALTHWRTLYALARMHEREPTLVSQMIRVAIGGLGLFTAWEILQAPGLTEEQLAAMQSELLQMDFVATVVAACEGERAWGMTCFALLRSNRSLAPSTIAGGSVPTNPMAAAGDHFSGSVWRDALADGDELFYLEHWQRTIEAVRRLAKDRAWSEVAVTLTRLRAELQVADSSWLAFTRPLSRVAIPQFERAVVTAVKHETLRQMTLAAIALRRFGLRHGKLPAELDALMPEFLPMLPLDVFSGWPLRYRLNTDGTFTLYSVGEDGKDDGGDAQPKIPPKAGASRLLWDGADAVWPFAADEPPPSAP